MVAVLQEKKVLMENTIFTIGHSTHTIDYFIKRINQHNISLVCDVRSQPYSRYNSHFNKENIKKALLENEIEYLFLGKELGGRSTNTSCYNNKGQLQYHLLSQELLFKKGLEKVIEKIQIHNIALMCSEAEPLQCHRTILVCRQLYQTKNVSKVKIQHIMSDGSTQSHTEIESTLIDKFKLFPDMLRNESECIATAYNLQAQKIAYTIESNSNLLEESQKGISLVENNLI